MTSFLKDPRQRSIALFILKAVLLYVVWFVSYDFFIAPSGKADAWLNERVATDTGFLLSITGFEGGTTPGIQQTIVTIKGKEMVGVGNPCNGFELFVLFTGFILCFPGQWKNKAWFIPAGILTIHFINVLRAMALALIQYKAPEYLDFNHHYTFTVVVYAFIFLLWMIWVNRFSVHPQQASK